ncbi:hypothetical protein ACKC9G_15340 [Pokkaliibacter sp. CJK22405]|uniref:hypothetical protein n=1 Tax=Pokkaliibacter sp. CJK22405 TaxID=3384615 RepID=UPI003984DEB9
MTRVWLAPLSLLAFALGGCQQWNEQNLKSPVPQAETYPYTTQQKMQTAHHWDVLASDMANQIAMSLPDRNMTVYVDEPAEQTDFAKAFHQMLQSQLMKHQVIVAVDPVGGAAHVKYSAQLLQHQGIDGAKAVPGTYTVLGTGLAVMRNAVKHSWEGSYLALPLLGLGADYLTGRTTSIEGAEVLITTQMVYGSTLLMSESDLYYINKEGAGHYTSVPNAMPAKTMQVVGE